MKFSSLVLNLFFINVLINASNIEYSKCLETRVYCQSIPDNCVRDNTQCDVLLIASPSSNSGEVGQVQFELFGRIDKKRQWFAMGLSSDNIMGTDSVTEIYISTDGQKQEMRQSWNGGKSNQVINGGINGITQVGDVLNTDGILRAKWIRKGVTEVHSTPFDIINNKYYILLASGPIGSNNEKRFHSKERSVSSTKVDLQFSNDQSLQDLYENCNQSEKTICLGSPQNCIKSKKCDLVLAITKGGYGLTDGSVAFQLMGKLNDPKSGWIAQALSDDNQMGSDSVVECLQLSDSSSLFRNSWNSGKTNEVIGAVEGVNQTGPTVFEDGWLNCKWTRTAQTTVQNIDFDLKNKKYYILIAKGKNDPKIIDKKQKHLERIASDKPFDFELQPITTTVGPNTSSTPIPSTLSGAYERCRNKTRLCFGSNSEGSTCVESSDCTLLFSCVAKSGGDVEIELFWERDSSSSDHWSAVGLSNDKKMGEDSVTECRLKSDGSVSVNEGWNPGGHKNTINVITNSITTLETSFLNGIVYCKWGRKAYSSIDGHDFDIKNTSFYLLLAFGPLTSAALMIIGWLGCVASAILLARHYKNSWSNSTLCGVKLWFAFHRTAMILGVVSILISTVIIFVNKEGWVGASSHPIVGLTSIILCFLQPIGALFRPNPDSPKRWIFNWLHWSGGYIGYVLSFVAICLSTNFSNLWPKHSLWILIAYIIVYIFSHVLHHLKTLIRNRCKQKDIEIDKSGKEALVDLVLAFLNVVIIMAFVVALLILLFI